ncbi:MAG: DNA gyrase C-terminal beta-propeller domain-containing protein, partial [Arthrobacter sp.]
VQEEDEVLVVMQGGKVVRSAVSGVPAKGRDTMGVIFAKPDKNDRIIAVARNSERDLAVDADEDEAAADGESVEASVDEVPLSTDETAGRDAQSAEDGGSE